MAQPKGQSDISPCYLSCRSIDGVQANKGSGERRHQCLGRQGCPKAGCMDWLHISPGEVASAASMHMP